MRGGWFGKIVQDTRPVVDVQKLSPFNLLQECRTLTPDWCAKWAPCMCNKIGRPQTSLCLNFVEKLAIL